MSPWRVAPIVLALPLLGGAGVCGNVLFDITQRELILAPVESIHFEVDSGAVEVYAWSRNGTSLFYYMVGSDYDIGDVGHRVDADELRVFSICDRSDFCTVSWYAEVPLGTSIDIQTYDGGVKLTGVDAEVTADVVGGGFDGVLLRAPTLDLGVHAGDVTIDSLVSPTAFVIEVGEGNVQLTLPPGAYRCELATAEGTIDITTTTCDPAAPALVHVAVELGDITLVQGPPP